MSKDGSHNLVAVDAGWSDGPEAGGWIADRLGPFGGTVGHAVPLGYPAYAVVPLPLDVHPPTDGEPLSTLGEVLNVLGRFTGDQLVHCGMWEGWSWWYEPGEDPRTAPGMSAGVFWSETDHPTQEEMDRALADAREELAAERVQRPDVEPLELPHRRYYLWTGPLPSAMAFRHQPQDPPSLVWSEDRSWFVGAPIYTTEIAVAGRARSSTLSSPTPGSTPAARPPTFACTAVTDRAPRGSVRELCEHVFVRWSEQAATQDRADRLPGYEDAVVRTFDAPEALETRFHEVHTKTALNRVPASSRVPFRWTINPYRGCTHACTYCFARPTHEYLGLEAGRDFEREIIVKVNVPEVLRAELARPRWGREHVALGTNTDPYQWVEGRYRLMRGIWAALRDAANPCSILTKSPLVLRDVDLLREVAAVTDVSACLSVPTLDEKVWRSVEPRAPNPRARLEAVAELNRQGIPTGILIAPLMPGVNDAPEQVEAIVQGAHDAGAVSIGGNTLFLRGAVRGIFFDWLRAQRPDLVGRYERLYARGAYLTPAVRDRIERAAQVPWRGETFEERFRRGNRGLPDATPQPPPPARPLQGSLF